MLVAVFFSSATIINIQYLPLNENLPKFYRDIISHWQKIKNTNPKTKRDVLNQTIRNNQFIRVNI